MRQSADFRFKLRAPKSLHLLESCTFGDGLGALRRDFFFLPNVVGRLILQQIPRLFVSNCYSANFFGKLSSLNRYSFIMVQGLCGCPQYLCGSKENILY